MTQSRIPWGAGFELLDSFLRQAHVEKKPQKQNRNQLPLEVLALGYRDPGHTFNLVQSVVEDDRDMVILFCPPTASWM